jgi:hypothetical protein
MISKFVLLIDLFFRKFFNRNGFLPLVHDYIESKQYYPKIINNKKINFFCPSTRTFLRAQELYTKEPETLNWVENFKSQNSNKIIFGI